MMAATDWPTWAHDYQYASASTIPVDDSNGVRHGWPLPWPSPFNPTDSTDPDDMIYVSSDQRVAGSDLNHTAWSDGRTPVNPAGLYAGIAGVSFGTRASPRGAVPRPQQFVGTNAGPGGTAAIHQALFGVDALSNDPAVIEMDAVDVARRAARWDGFARRDVNDDGLVDLGDVCWLLAGRPIYPDRYCGDVDQGDIDYLFAFVTDNGPGPRGEWRFAALIPPTRRI